MSQAPKPLQTKKSLRLVPADARKFSTGMHVFSMFSAVQFDQLIKNPNLKGERSLTKSENII